MAHSVALRCLPLGQAAGSICPGWIHTVPDLEERGGGCWRGHLGSRLPYRATALSLAAPLSAPRGPPPRGTAGPSRRGVSLRAFPETGFCLGAVCLRGAHIDQQH